MIRLSEILIAFGISFENVVMPIVFITVPFLTYTIPISFMFALMLSFTRLNADGEFTAILAAGQSLLKTLRPVFVLTCVLLVAAVYTGTFLESWGRREYLEFKFRKTQTELDNFIRSKMQPGVFVENFLGYTFYAETIGPNKENYEKIFITPTKVESASRQASIVAPRGKIEGSVEEESLKMTLYDGKSFTLDREGKETKISQFSEMKIDILKLFRQQIFGSESRSEDYRSLSIVGLYHYLEDLKSKGEVSSTKYYKPHYLFHQRIALGFAVFYFGFFGVVLGISDVRRGKGKAYTFAIFTVISSYVFTTSLKGLGQSGELHAAVASWGPVLLQIMFGAFLLYQKNRLPPSESVLAPSNLPIIRKLLE